MITSRILINPEKNKSRNPLLTTYVEPPNKRAIIPARNSLLIEVIE
jgi:hypothetical protein